MSSVDNNLLNVLEEIIEGLKKAMGALEEIFGMTRMNADAK